VSAQSTWRALDEAGEARTAANRPAFLPQTLAFGAQTFFWPCNLPQERYNFVKPVSKKEIPVNSSLEIEITTNPVNRLNTCREGSLTHERLPADHIQ
jgi:hypothetical protein